MSFCTVAAAQPFSRCSDGVVAAYDGSWYEESKALFRWSYKFANKKMVVSKMSNTVRITAKSKFYDILVTHKHTTVTIVSRSDVGHTRTPIVVHH
jgi:hypothetical protein